MKNVMFVCCNFAWGGIEQYILNVIDSIDKDKFNISVLLLGDMIYDNEKALYDRNVSVYKLKKRKIRDKIKEFRIVIQNEKINVVHLTLGYLSYVFAKTALRTEAEKVIIHSHTSQSGNEHINFPNKIVRKIYFFYANKFICNNTINLACSELAAEYLFSKSISVEILWNGIDIDRFRNAQVDANFLNKYRINRNKINVLTVGRLDNPKNPLFLIRVFNELVKINKQYNLIYVGSGPLKDEVYALEERLNLKNHIVHISNTNEVSKLMKCSDAFILPSIFEGLPLVLIEAQASGLKCFVSDGVSKLSNCGLCTFFSLNSEYQMIAENINRTIKKDSKMKLNEREINKFSVKNTVRRLEEIYS